MVMEKKLHQLDQPLEEPPLDIQGFESPRSLMDPGR